MESTRLKKARETHSFLESQRTSWESHWREIAEYIVPRKGRFTGSSQHEADSGERRGGRIIDATATRAVRVLAAGMQGGLTSPARPWFRLRLEDRDLMEFGPVRMWLDDVETRIYGALARSNFYQSIHGMYTELGAFGSADLYHETDRERVMNFSCLTCGEYAWATNAWGRVDTVVRRCMMTARQIAEKYGEHNLSRSTRRKLTKEPYGFVEVVHLVMPRRERDAGKKDFRNMPWASLVFEANGEADDLLHEGGYEEFPHLCARWDVAGTDIYGRSPGMDALPDVKMLQEMAKSQLLAVHKVVNPPMRVPTGYKQRLNLIPGAQNYVNPNQPEALAPLYQINPDIQAVSYKIDDVRKAIREGFFNDLFLMFAGDSRSNVTAAEIMERSQEKLLMLGPVIERYQTEILDPLITRSFGILHRNGLLPPVPPELAGEELNIEYVSVLAQAQKQSSGNAIRQLTLEVGRMAAVAPQVLDKIDFDQCVDELAAIAGAPARIIRSDDDVQRLRMEKAQAAQQQAQLEQAMRMTRSAKDLSAVETGEGNALEMVLRGSGLMKEKA
ncbi:MAG: portal protein [Halodesulfovibrio sp.]